jgi:hypothetical protein
MDDRYEAYAMADPTFYDAMSSTRTAGASFPTADRPVPAGWRRSEQDDWFVFTYPPAVVPEQGWKIHASATLDNAERVLDAVWDYCVPRGIPFKFLRSRTALTARVSKYAPRGYSGKLVTIYPADDAACETILTELGTLLEGEPSPYILSDLRWGSGPLYVRYGALRMRYGVDDNGQVFEALVRPDGELVRDRRDPVFHVPDWVTLPDFLAPHLAARNAVTVADLPYAVDKVIHFSNGGGIYAGTDKRTGQPIVLKEARPYAGLDGKGEDAVRRLEREYDMLRHLAGIPGIPAVHDLFWVGEHRFMAMEHVDGSVLSSALVSRYPLTDPTAGPAERAAYAEWATATFRRIEECVTQINERGIVYGDLHLFNVVVREDGSIALLDFEVAAPVAEATTPALNNQGFAPPRSATGVDIDRYALACLRLALFLPMTSLLWLHRPKAREYAEIIREHFPVSPEYLAAAVDIICPPDTPPTPRPRTEPDPGQWPDLRDDLARAILASATPERDDRLFPGDVEQFGVGGLGLAHGAAGVLYALAATGAGRYPDLDRWLARRAVNPPQGTRPGLYDGLHGVAFALDALDYPQHALDTLDICLRENWRAMGHDLGSGLAGIGLNLLHFGDRTGDRALRETGLEAAELVAAKLAATPFPAGDRPVSGGREPYAGLIRGWAGAALLFLRVYDDTDDQVWLDRAHEALRRDLARCVVRDTGVLEVNEGWRTMPYLDVGSIGIGVVLDRYLDRLAGRADEQFATASRGIEKAAQLPMYILPNLFSGRAGILLYLAGRSPDPLTDPAVARQVRNLAWHALPYGDGMAFPGTGLLRLSMDLATGTAGVLLALGAALHDEPVRAPLLPARGDRAVAPQTPAPAGAGHSNT